MSNLINLLSLILKQPQGDGRSANVDMLISDIVKAEKDQERYKFCLNYGFPTPAAKWVMREKEAKFEYWLPSGEEMSVCVLYGDTKEELIDKAMDMVKEAKKLKESQAILKDTVVAQTSYVVDVDTSVPSTPDIVKLKGI